MSWFATDPSYVKVTVTVQDLTTGEFTVLTVNKAPRPEIEEIFEQADERDLLDPERPAARPTAQPVLQVRVQPIAVDGVAYSIVGPA